MALDVGTLSAKIRVDTAGVNSSLNSVKRDLNDVKKSADKAENIDIDVTPKGTGDVTRAAREAGELAGEMREAGTAGKQVEFNPNVANELDRATDSGISLRGVLSNLGGVAGVVGLSAAVGGVGAAFTDTIQAGKAYRSELNTMNAVSGATEAQMRAVSDAAKQLGNDNDLANTSAADAAAAMTELAKGGFSVEQSMAAAKGTLQLAAAAQTDAASAATIQSQALQAFRLEADQAARVSDVLAGAANASSAEIGDVAAALQQSGTVANQFGMSIEDTATSIAMFANAGITGSDAGTLLKTALLSLTDQGAPAQAAIEELGLTVYDANGKFVGMADLLGQLNRAAGEMSDEQYQAATATLFGSDAMRLAGIAAEQGTGEFNNLKEAVTRQGQAADVAAAQTEGITGAIGRVENAWETAQTSIFEATEGGMVAALDVVSGGIEAVTNAITGPGFKIGGQLAENLGGQIQFLAGVAKSAGDAITGVLVPGADDMAGAFEAAKRALSGLDDGLSGWQVPLASAALVGLAANVTGVTGKLSAGGGAVARFGQEMRVQQALAKGYGKELGTVGSALSVLRSRNAELDGALTKAGGAYMRASANLRVVASSHTAAARAAKQQALTTQNGFAAADRIISQAGHTMVASTARMGGAAAGLANGGLSLMGSAFGGVKRAASGLIDAMGGPWSLAIMGASAVIGHLVQKHQEAKQAEEEHAQAQRELKDSLDPTTGAITEQTRALQEKKLEETGALDAARELGIATGTLTDAINGNAQAQREVQSATSGAMQEAISNSDAYKYAAETMKTDAWHQAGVDVGTFKDALQGVPEAVEKVNSVEGGAEMLGKLRDEINGSEDAAAKLGMQIGDLNKDMEANKAAVMADALNNLERQSEQTSKFMDLLGESIVSIPDDKTIHVSSMAPEVRKQVKELGLEVEDLPDGTVKVTFPDGSNITQVLTDMGAKIRALPDGSITLSDNAPEVQERLIQLGIAVKDEKTGEVKIKDNIAEVIGRQTELGAAVKLETGEVYVKDNTGEVLANLNALGIGAQMLPPGHVRITDDTPENRQRLAALGFQTVTLPGGHIGITDTSPQNMQRLAELGIRTTTLPGGFVEITDTSDANKQRLAELGVDTTTLPDGRVVITDNANETRDHIKSTLSAENTNTFSDHVINITRRIKDIFERADGGFTPPVQAFAAGGAVNQAVHRRARSNHEPEHKAHIAPAGSYRVFAEPETGGEAYIPLAESKRTRSSQILGQVANQFGYHLVDDEGQVQQFADGALLQAAAIKKRLDYMDGTPYIFGGWSPSGVDCSGAVSLAVNVSEGLDEWDSRTATANEAAWLRAKGYRPGKGGLGDIRVGFMNGGPGGGHTAMQLEDGTYIESGGNTGGGFTIGGKAGPLEGRGFTDWFYKRGATPLGNEGLDDLESLNGVIGAPGMGGTINQLRGSATSTTAGEPARELNGGAGTLIKDGSFLELMAALYSKHTGQKMADDVVSWGQVVGLYSKVADTNTAVADSVASNTDALRGTADSLDVTSDLVKTTKGIGGTSGNKYADEIIKEGQRRGISDTGIKIALATALVESGLKMYANRADPQSLGYPHDAVGSDHDSVGLFQQRNNGAWGTLADRMDPAKSAGMFYDKLDDADYNKGDPGMHAQRVQGSAFPDRYATRMGQAQDLLNKYKNAEGAKITAMANGGILGGLRQASINDGSSAVLWAEAGPEAYIPLSSDKRARSLDIWAETGKRLGVDVMSMLNLIGSGLPGLAQGKLDFSTGGSISAEALGVNMDAASYRGKMGARDAGQQAHNAVGAVFNGPVQINDPKKYLQGQVDNANKQLGKAMRSFLL